MDKATIIKYLEALASGIGKQDADISYSFYAIVSTRLLETEAEREAFRYGALALYANAANKWISHWRYTNKFEKALKQL